MTEYDTKNLPAPDSWASFFSAVRERPSMWLYKPSPLDLHTFIRGMIFSTSVHKPSSSKCWEDFNFQEFESWVSKNFNSERMSINSFHLADHLSETGELGFKLWFKWYDQYS